jgi:hypothetical protein
MEQLGGVVEVETVKNLTEIFKKLFEKQNYEKMTINQKIRCMNGFDKPADMRTLERMETNFNSLQKGLVRYLKGQGHRFETTFQSCEFYATFITRN